MLYTASFLVVIGVEELVSVGFQLPSLILETTLMARWRWDEKYHMTTQRKWYLSRKRLAVRFPVVESSLYLTENLSGGQLPPMLWHWLVGLQSQKTKRKGGTSTTTGLRENLRLVIDEVVEFGKWPVEVGDFKRLTDRFRGIYRRIYLEWMKASKVEYVNM